GVEVDLERLAASIAAEGSGGAPRVLVGHLAHLLPVGGAVVLRCHPIELARRLGGRRPPLSEFEREENVACEATEIVLAEVREFVAGPVLEIDATRRSPSAIAAEIARWLRRPRSRSARDVAWLRDPRVPALLLAAPSYRARWSRKGTAPGPD